MRTTLPPCTRAGVAAGFATLQLRAWARQAGQRLGVGRPSPIALEDLQAPDSGLVARARALAAEAYDPHLLGHGERTWALARAVALHLRLAPDPEALYVACLLHDLGLTPRFAGEAPFELRGAEAARHVCLPDESRGDVVHEAIALHTSLRAALGPAEVRLVQTGSGGDLVGLDAELVHPSTRGAILARWPITAEYGAHILERLRTETAPHPESPGARLLQVGFAGRLHAYQRERLRRAPG